MKNGICVKCNRGNVKKMYTYDDKGEHGSTKLKLAQYKDPDAWIFKGTTLYDMYAIACFDCGYVEFYMENY